MLELPALIHGIPPPPPASLDPLLDAASRCFSRHGIRRTSVQDIARELRVNRTTVYRQVGNVEAVARLLLARDMHRLLVALPVGVQGAVGPEAVVRLIETTIGQARAHPVLTKVLEDEPQLIGPVLVADLGTVAGRVVDVVAPLLEALMDAGQLARRDARVVAEWLVRLTVTLILAPPPGDLRAFLTELIVPALAPTEEAR